MDSAKRFFRRYFLSSMVILSLFLAANLTLFFIFLLITGHSFGDTVMPVSQIAGLIHVDSQWNVSADEKALQLLREKNTWAMVLNDSGAVIWEASMPEDLPRQYTSADIAKFSRWYLGEYPVLVQAMSFGLLVLGCPADSITKLNYVTDSDTIDAMLYGGFFVISANILLVLVLFWWNTRKVEKAVVPILHGIEIIAQGNAVSLEEKGGLSEISAALNRTGALIQKKENARAEWIHGVSHDVRTPLSVILGYAGELEDNKALPQAARQQAGIIQKQGEKLRRLIADLNLTSKLEYSMQPLRLETIYPVELARQVVSEFLNNGLEDTYTIDFETSSDDAFATMQGDEALLKRMLGNLIQNSISHNPGGCGITLAVRTAEKNCEFIIQDDGNGLLVRQVEQFNSGTFSGAGCNTDGENTHGFGLRLVHQIVSAHKGRIYFQPLSPHGLLVTITFIT